MLLGFDANLDSEPDLIGDMLGRNERSGGNGVGFKSANVDKGGEVVGKEEEEEEEEDKEWKPVEDARRVAYNGNGTILKFESTSRGTGPKRS